MRTVNPWAQAILDVIRVVTPHVVAELEDDMGEGVEIKKVDGDKIRQALKKVGYKPTESEHNMWIIPSSAMKQTGITIDYRNDMDYEPDHCLIVFYDLSM
jgi:hypothetical protein